MNHWRPVRGKFLLVASLLVCGVACGSIAMLWKSVYRNPGARLSQPLATDWLITRVKPRSATAAKIIAGARAQQGTLYDAAYVRLSYPNGDVSPNRGACTDVVVRSLRNAGYDLQKLIHNDMKRRFHSYPRKWGLTHPDPNIDHRRVPNQMRFFEKYALSLPREVSAFTLSSWQPGDLVYWDLGEGRLHTGVVSNAINARGIPLVIHNGSICIEDDCLTRWKIIGHYRYPKPQIT